MKNDNHIRVRTKWADCPDCEGSRQCDVLCAKKIPFDLIDEASIAGDDSYFTLKCKGCGAVFFLHETTSHEYFVEENAPTTIRRYYPASKTRHGRFLNDFDLPLSSFQNSIYNEIISAINNKMPIVAAMGIRTLTDSIVITLDKENMERYRENLDNFVKKGFFTEKQRGIIEAAIEIGHGAVHRNHIPEMRDVNEALDIVESMIEQHIVNQAKAERIKSRIPSRPKKDSKTKAVDM